MHYTFTLDYFSPQYYSAASVREQSASNSGAPLAGPHLKASTESGNTTETRTPFQWLVVDTLARISPHTTAATAMDPTFAQRKSLNGKIELHAQQWDLQFGGRKFAQLRMVHIRGAKNEIINTWIFPVRPRITPVFAAELIAVNGSVRVAFVDIQTPAACQATVDEVRLLTALLAPRYTALPCDEVAPGWATEASTGHFTYARNVPATQMATVQDCYMSYLDTYLSAFISPDLMSVGVLDASDQSASEVLHRYQMHHMQHSPGSIYLGKLFGADWTESFMRSFLFAKPC